MEQTVIFTGDIYYTQHFPDPRLPFQGRNDKEELFMQPCLGECLHFLLISTPAASSVQGCSVSVGRKTACRALPLCPDAVAVIQRSQEITSSRMPLLQQPWTCQSSGFSYCTILQFWFREEIPAALSSSCLVKGSSLEANSAIHSLREHPRTWPAILAGSRVRFPSQINLPWKGVPNPQLIRSAQNSQLMETSHFYHLGCMLAVWKANPFKPLCRQHVPTRKMSLKWSHPV